MTDTPPEAGQQVAVQTTARPPREIIRVESISPIMDTAKFEHMGRVATIMAQAGLMPESLTTYAEGTGNARQVIPHDFETIRARAFLIVNQAALLEMDPNALAQCVGFVHGKLVYEGKVVHAALESRLGIRLRYEFGTYDPRTRLVSGDIPTDPESRWLGVRVVGKFPDEEFERDIHGSVSAWHTGDRGPWQKSSAWQRQLRYMGAREWDRAHAGITLGMMTHDEVEAAREDRAALPAPQERPRRGKPKDDVVGKLTAGAGTHAAAVIATAEEVAAGATITDPGTRQRPAEGFSTAHVDSEMKHDKETGEIIEGEVIDGERQDEDEDVWPTAGIHVGSAPAGVTYQLYSDEPGEDGKVPTYKDGVEFSRVGRKGAANVPCYHDHAPTAEQQAAAAEPQGASQAAETGGGSQTTGEAAEAGAASPEPEDDRKAADPEPEQEAGGFMAEIRSMSEWMTIKLRVARIMNTDDFKALEPEDQDNVRRMIWEHVQSLIDGGTITLDFATDPTAFRLWMTTQTNKLGADRREASDAIEGNYRVLKRAEAYGKMAEATRQGFENTVLHAINTLRAK